MKATLSWALGLLLVVLAGVVTAIAPDEDDTYEPFAVRASVGERAEGRDIAVTVTNATLADRVTADGWSAEGNWLVVDLEAAAVRSETGALLALAQLQVGGRTYVASERPQSVADEPLRVGLPRSGSLAFELPDDAAGDATLRLGRSRDDRRDSVIALPLDLDATQREPEVALALTGWAIP